MAVKKTEEIVETKRIDLWTKMRTVRIPRAPRGGKQSELFSVNGRQYIVPFGKSVEVPEPIARIVDSYLDAISAADDFRDEIPNE